MSTKLSCGIVGLPNVGKSTLFNALTKKSIPASNYPFCTIDPNEGDVILADSRLEVLSKLSHSTKILPAHVCFVDIAGLVKGASTGEGLGNKFLANIRETDLIIHVVRCFEEENVIHVEGKIDPIQDIEIINTELILSDLQILQNIIQKMQKQAKGNKELEKSIAILTKAQEHLNQGQPLRSLSLSAEEKAVLDNYPIISAKEVIYLTNVSEKDLPHLENEYVQKVKEYAKKENAHVLGICAKLEEELAALPDEEALLYLQEIGLKETGLNRLVKLAFETLGLVTFITTGEQETRAWTIKKGTKAPQAAGKIHSDLEKGFIRAEVIPYEQFVACTSRAAAKEKGLARSEGKDYIVQDGDVILFYHN